MQKITLHLLVFITFSIPIFSQWILQNSGINNELYSVSFIDNSNGWIVGAHGTVLHTTNSGLDWELVNVNNSNDLNSIFFVDDLNGWIVGDNGTVIRTTNSGIDWAPQYSGVTYPLWEVFFINESNGWIGTLSATADVLRTTNGGENWSAITTGIVNTLTIFFTSDLNGWAGGWGGELARTTDGGMTWFNQSSGTNVSRTKIFFIDQQTGWTVGGGGKITKTTDSGNSWFLIPFNNFDYLRSIYFIDGSLGWIIGDNSQTTRIYNSSDGGYNWYEEFESYGEILDDITFSDSVNGWAIGFDGFIVKYDTTKFVQVVSPNGGEVWFAGQNNPIQWTSNNVDLVNLEYSTDSGFEWILINDSLESDGYYQWSLPYVNATQCLIMITSIGNQNIFDISDSHFSIVPDTLETIILIHPNGGEQIVKNTIYDVYWYDKDINYVNIEFSLDNGYSWLMLDSNHTSLYYYGNFNWTVPDTSSDSCRIKVTNTNYISTYDISDNVFKIIDEPLSVNETLNPKILSLSQNYPNPFNPSTKIRFTIPTPPVSSPLVKGRTKEGFVTLKIYDVLGNEIATLVNEEKQAGTYEVEFKVETHRNASLPSGIYFYQLRAGNYVETKKMLLLK